MKKGLKDLPIGGTFVWSKLIYEVRESSSCKDCSFCITDYGCTVGLNNGDIPCCNSLERKDNKDVIFIQVGEIQD